MREFSKDISYRAFYLLLAVGFLWMMPTFVHLFSEFATAVLVPLLENALQSAANSGVTL